MKISQLLSFKVVHLHLLIYLLLISGRISSQQIFTVTAEKNPWSDNYLSISSMTDFQLWGTYNVHDPSCLLVGDTYYMFSTDAIYGEDSTTIKKMKLPFGYIQVRKSKDLVHWKFSGWAFPEIPEEAREWVLSQSGGKGATNIWAPYILKNGNKFRLYYSVSAFGKQTSYIGLAESDSPEGPWEQKGCVVKTTTGDVMNAIDPSIVTNPADGTQWMHYGSYFGGLHVLQLNPRTGLALKDGTQGISTARRHEGQKNNIEAPEIIYNPVLKKYFLFVSYDPLMTTYNVRVGRSDSPEGPFYDYFGNDMRKEEDNYPILTYPYRFKNHPGWAGTAHCGVFKDKNGDFFMAHQARLSPENHQMVLHIRKIFWTKEGWPAVSPERYNGDEDQKISADDVPGKWEIIFLRSRIPNRGLEAGQILWGENLLQSNEVDTSQIILLNKDHSLSGEKTGDWQYSDNFIKLKLDREKLDACVFIGHDWENQTRTLLFTAIDKQGNSVWGKKIH